MSQVVNVNTLPQNGRATALKAPLNPTSIRFSQIVTATPISFVFPQGAGTNFTFGIPQYMFVDNSFNNFEMVVSVQGTSYNFPVPALSSGYYRLDAIDGDTILVTSAGVSSDLVEIVFYNFTLAPIVWYKNQSTSTAVTIADGADAAEGSVADVPVTNPALNGTVIGLLKGLVSLLSTGIVIATSKVQGLMASGSTIATAGNPLVVAGQDGVHSQSLLTDTSGRLFVVNNGTFAVQSTLQAGTNVIGKVDINQTTPGTTNGVVVNAALPVGSNVIGGVTIADGSDVTQGAKADAAITNPASSGSVVAFLKGILTQLQSTNKVVQTSPYPSGATPLTATSGVVSNASAVATLAGTAGKTTYISGFDVTSDGATAVSVVTAVLSGLISGSQSYVYTAVAGATTQDLTLALRFSPPIPASAANTAIVMTLPALGAGNTAACVNAHGYQL